jgi:hypothetical protein
METLTRHAEVGRCILASCKRTPTNVCRDVHAQKCLAFNFVVLSLLQRAQQVIHATERPQSVRNVRGRDLPRMWKVNYYTLSFWYSLLCSRAAS